MHNYDPSIKFTRQVCTGEGKSRRRSRPDEPVSGGRGMSELNANSWLRSNNN
jgi:hypothetical protein